MGLNGSTPGDAHPPAEPDALDGSVTVGEALELAVQLHREGKLPVAETLYDNILDAAPDYADALHFSGILRTRRIAPRPASPGSAAPLPCSPVSPACTSTSAMC